MMEYASGSPKAGGLGRGEELQESGGKKNKKKFKKTQCKAWCHKPSSGQFAERKELWQGTKNSGSLCWCLSIAARRDKGRAVTEVGTGLGKSEPLGPASPWSCGKGSRAARDKNKRCAETYGKLPGRSLVSAWEQVP